VMLQGIPSNPIIDEHTKPRRQITGTMRNSGAVAPSAIHLVTTPEINMHTAIKNVDTIMRNRLLNFFMSHAFKSDIKNRTTPKNIDDMNGSKLSAPTSYKQINF
jgi:hypothetical protein